MVVVDRVRTGRCLDLKGQSLDGNVVLRFGFQENIFLLECWRKFVVGLEKSDNIVVVVVVVVNV